MRQNAYVFFKDDSSKVMTYEFSENEQSFICIKYGNDEFVMPTKVWRSIHQGWNENGWSPALDDLSCVDDCFQDEEE